MEDQLKHYLAKLEYEIDSADVADYFQNPEQKEKMVVIDVRTAESFRIEHIPGSFSFPHRSMTVESTKSLDKNTRYVTYCDGIGCNGSTKGAFKLTSFGFKVQELTGGLDWWKRDGYTTEGTAGVKRNTFVNCNC